jgi:hypothetical protein
MATGQGDSAVGAPFAALGAAVTLLLSVIGPASLFIENASSSKLRVCRNCVFVEEIEC